MNQTLDTVFHTFPHLDLKKVQKINETSFKKTNHVYFFLIGQRNREQKT